MTFKIYNTETNKLISLKEFDSLFYQFTGEKENPYIWGTWFTLLEGILHTYGNIADYGKDSNLYNIVKDSRILDLHQAAQMLLIWCGRTLSKSDKFDDINYIKNTLDFFQHYQDKYYIEFHF